MSAPAGGLGRREAWLLLAVALAARVGAMLALDSPGRAEGATAWAWGGESAALAASLVEGRGYGDPWAHGTGPSGWLTPPYPGLVALLLALFGGVGRASATALYLLQSLASATTCVLAGRLGGALGMPRAGRLGAWLLALYPPAIWNAAQTVWDTTWVALGLTLFLWRLVAAHAGERAPSVGRVVLLGLGFGLLLFVNPAPLAILPAVLAFLALAREEERVLAPLAFTVAALVPGLPWMARNAAVVDAFALRPNFGVELMIGNHDGATGRPEPTKYHPSHVAAERARYLELGEGAYARECMGRALEWIRAHPDRFAALTVRRLVYFWIGEPPWLDARASGGVGAARDPLSWIKFAAFAASGAGALVALALLRDLGRGRWTLVAGVLLLFAAPYAVTHVSERYRFPLDPLIVVLDARLVLEILRRRRDPIG